MKNKIRKFEKVLMDGLAAFENNADVFNPSHKLTIVALKIQLKKYREIFEL